MAETKIKEVLEKQKEAIEELESQETIAAYEKQAEENGWDVGFADTFEQKPLPAPKVRLIRRSTVGDSIAAERLARKSFDVPHDESVTDQQLVIAKCAILFKFNDEQWDVHKIGQLGGDFLSHILMRFARFMN